MHAYETLRQLTHDRCAQLLRDAQAERLYCESRARTRRARRRATLRAGRELAARQQTA
jgi:hypothetical protein